MPGCPKRRAEQVVKNGRHLGRQRNRCKYCGLK